MQRVIYKYLEWVCISGKEPKFGAYLAETWLLFFKLKIRILAVSIICGGAKIYIGQCQIEVG